MLITIYYTISFDKVSIWYIMPVRNNCMKVLTGYQGSNDSSGKVLLYGNPLNFLHNLLISMSNRLRYGRGYHRLIIFNIIKGTTF